MPSSFSSPETLPFSTEDIALSRTTDMPWCWQPREKAGDACAYFLAPVLSPLPLGSRYLERVPPRQITGEQALWRIAVYKEMLDGPLPHYCRVPCVR